VLDTTTHDYDVFISYAREDGDWVRANLYDPLVRCRTKDGRKPRVFLDVDKEGVPPGANFIMFLAEAIARSHTVVAVYSSTYFSKEMCLGELSKAVELDPTGMKGKLRPILIDPSAANSVPAFATGINYIGVERDDWFEILVSSLDFTPPEQPDQLSFLDRPGDVTAHYTLPPIRVAITRDGDTVARSEIVSLTVEGGSLNGTSSVEAVDGVASFDDLSIETALDSTRFMAAAEGCLPAYSDSFAVRPTVVPKAEAIQARIPAVGELAFFENDKAVAVFGARELGVYDFTGKRLAEAGLDSRTRLLRRSDSLLALAAWSGRIDLVTSDGAHGQWHLAPEGGRYAVPGDLQIEDERAFVGLWNGEVFRLELGKEAERVLDHPAGVQCLAAMGETLVICGLDGGLCFYQAGRMVRSHQLERSIRLLKPLGNHVLAVGETHLHRVPVQAGHAPKIELQLDGAAAALGEPAWPIVIDHLGKAIVVDQELSVRGSFHAGAGAELVGSDRQVNFCVVRKQDGSHSLVDLTAAGKATGGTAKGRVTFNVSGGALAVSPSGMHFALGSERDTRILSTQEMDELLGDTADA
jgi:hypothetical protein